MAEIDMILSLSKKTSIAVKFVAMLTLSLIGGCAMSADIELKWEWPADRAIEDRFLIKVEKVKAQDSGLFGLKKSPSFASNIPEPTVITGVVQNKGTVINGKSLKVVAPKPEAEEIEAGSYAVLGVVDKDVCICIVPVESADIDITQINCP
ncbi:MULTISPECIES: hypothetical protein [unclassified Microbulbifer]|uniref:hypothetical protein n=1 Tax=unclassified Microbulbifer TaxID=2619833 RepID=UPI0027E45118|nr:MULTISPECIES: hypothetical protein [unclassified Microbulbifer]